MDICAFVQINFIRKKEEIISKWNRNDIIVFRILFRAQFSNNLYDFFNVLVIVSQIECHR